MMIPQLFMKETNVTHKCVTLRFATVRSTSGVPWFLLLLLFTNANVSLEQLPLQFLNFFTQRHLNVTRRVRDSGQPDDVMEHTIRSKSRKKRTQ